MSQRKRNMLEAFQASAQEDEGVVTPPGERSIAGPFAEDLEKQRVQTERTRAAYTKDARAPLPPPAPAPGPTVHEALGNIPLLYLGLFVVLLCGLSFWIGRVSAPETVRAAETPTRAPSGGGGGLGEVRLVPRTEADRAFNDPRNQLTLRVAAYDRSARGQEIAWLAYDYLHERGMPVVTPIQTQQSIFLYVGAAPDEDALGDLAARVRALPDLAPGSEARPFADAYPVNIDDVVRR